MSFITLEEEDIVDQDCLILSLEKLHLSNVEAFNIQLDRWIVMFGSRSIVVSNEPGRQSMF